MHIGLPITQMSYHSILGSMSENLTGRIQLFSIARFVVGHSYILTFYEVGIRLIP